MNAKEFIGDLKIGTPVYGAEAVAELAADYFMKHYDGKYILETDGYYETHKDFSVRAFQIKIDKAEVLKYFQRGDPNYMVPTYPVDIYFVHWMKSETLYNLRNLKKLKGKESRTLEMSAFYNPYVELRRENLFIPRSVLPDDFEKKVTPEDNPISDPYMELSEKEFGKIASLCDKMKRINDERKEVFSSLGKVLDVGRLNNAFLHEF